MSLREFYVHATEQPIAMFGAGAIGTAILGFIAFLVKRAINRNDKEHEDAVKERKTIDQSHAERIDGLREFVGQQEKENEALWRNIEELKTFRDKFIEVKK